MSTREAAIALRRFGLGSRPGDVARIAADPRGFVLSQLSKPNAALLNDPDLEPSHVVFAEAQRAQMEQRATKEAAKKAISAPSVPASKPAAPSTPPGPSPSASKAASPA